MALTKTIRHRAPLDGSWFRATANLNSVLRAASNYDDEMIWPKWVEDTRVTLFIRMVKYQAQKTRERPDGMLYGPIVRVGSMESPEVELFGSHHAAGLTQDYHLDGLDTTDKWLYYPVEGEVFPLGEDASYYTCDRCNQTLYRDDLGRRHDRSACLHDGALVCRDCEVPGLVYAADVEERLERCRQLADHIGPEARTKFEAQIGFLSRGVSFGIPCQTRLFLDGQWSFFWRDSVFTPEGRKNGMVGGLIQHGPHPHLLDDGSYRFTTWDYSRNCERPASDEEVAGFTWGIHT